MVQRLKVQEGRNKELQVQLKSQSLWEEVAEGLEKLAPVQVYQEAVHQAVDKRAKGRCLGLLILLKEVYQAIVRKTAWKNLCLCNSNCPNQLNSRERKLLTSRLLECPRNKPILRLQTGFQTCPAHQNHNHRQIMTNSQILWTMSHLRRTSKTKSTTLGMPSPNTKLNTLSRPQRRWQSISRTTTSPWSWEWSKSKC